MYDKAIGLPPDGSLQDALFQTVWLRRQEAELYRVRIMASGFMELIGAQGSQAKNTFDSFKGFMEAFLPFSKKLSAEKELKMKEFMKKETEKGMIRFDIIGGKANPFRQKAVQMQAPDPLQKKIYRNLTKGP